MREATQKHGRRGRRWSLRLALWATTALAAPLMAPASYAQDATEDEIVVTAQRREERTLDVGINISSINAEALTDSRVAQVADLAGLVGNMDIKEQVPGAIPVVTIRGVGLDDFSATNSASAGIYVDEVYLASTAMMSTEFFDLARIEVLKGPQGTLYGRNSTAGAINIISQPPVNMFEAFARVGYGNYEAAELEGMVNVPVSDQFALRFAARAVNQGEGYWTSRLLPGEDIGSRDVIAGRMQALLTPSDGFEILFKLEGERSNSEMGQPEFFGTIDPLTGGFCAPFLAGRTDNTQCTDFFGYTDTDGDPFVGDWTSDAHYDIEAWDATLRVNWALGFGTLTSITGYRTHDRSFFIDTDATPLPQTDFDQGDRIEQWSQEVRLTGENASLAWVVGAFVSHDEVDVLTPGFHDALFATRTRIDAHQETDSAAVFAHGEWALSEQLSLITGLRFTSEERSYAGGTIDLNPFGASFLCFCAAPTQLTFLDAEISDENWSWRLGLEYQPSRDTLWYANVSRGVKSGGFFSGITTSNDQLLPYDPEELTAYEIGFKGRFPDAGVRIEASAFYYDYSNFQSFVRFDSVPLPIQKLDNIAEAEVWGADIDLTWSPVEGLDLIGRFGLLETELGEFEIVSGTVPAGNALPNAPGLTFTGAARYGFGVGGDMRLTLQGDASFTDDVFKDALNDPIIASDAHWIFNARATLTPADEAWALAVWGRNLGDEAYVVQGLNVGQLGFGNRNYNAPRTYGVTLSYRWN